MCPAAGIQPLRVAPEDVELSEAGELTSKLGIYNQAKGLQAAVAKQMPRDLRIAMQRFEHVQRSKRLVPEELLARAQEAVVQEGGTPDVISRVLGGRVRADKNDPFDGAVIIQYEVQNGRVGYCAVLHNQYTFPESVAAYEEALAEGKVSQPGELADRGSLKLALDRTEEEVQRLARQNAELRAGQVPPEGDASAGDPGDVPPPEDDEVKLPDGVSPGDPGYPIDPATGQLVQMPDFARTQLIEADQRAKDATKAAEDASAQLQEADRIRGEAAQATPPPEPELTIEDLPEGVAPGDPGYPVDPETGELIQMPEATRQALIAQHEQTVEDGLAGEIGTTWPEDLSTVELPKGKADEVIPMMSYYSTPVLAAFAELDSRSTVAAAAAAELETRPDKPAEPAA